VASGANKPLAPDVRAARVAVEAAKIIVTQLERPGTVRETARIARRNKIPFILIRPRPALDDDLLKMIAFLTPNERKPSF